MTISTDNNAIGKFTPLDNYDPVQLITKLLADVGDQDLAEIHKLVIAEERRRVAEAENALINMKETFGQLSPTLPIRNSQKPPRLKTKSTNIAKSQNAKKGANLHDDRAPRGEAKKLILAFLETGPKNRKQLEEHFKDKRMPVSSIGTLLNRLKSANAIDHDRENKLYSILP